MQAQNNLPILLPIIVRSDDISLAEKKITKYIVVIKMHSFPE